MSDHVDVIIVGAGPVGLSLAVELGRRGVGCVLVERKSEISQIPKGQALTQRTMEHFRRFGVSDEIRAARTTPAGYPMGMVTCYDSLTSGLFAIPPARELVRDFYAEADERLPQYRTEEVLRRRLADLPSVRCLYGAEVVEIEQDETGVSAVVTREAGAERLEISADYVVGCDGARSLVRTRFGISSDGSDWDELVTLVVFRSPHLHEILEALPPAGTYRVMRPEMKGFWMFFGRVDLGERFFFHAPVPRGTTRETIDVEGILGDAAGIAFDFEVEHVGFWDLRVQVADEYRSGRAFIAGDAAHTHPPYGGFGLNNGVEDARNLGWKLAARLQGWGGDRLLDSYSAERQPVFSDVGERIIAGWIETDRQFLESISPQSHPDTFEELFVEMAQEYGRRYSSFEPHYSGSEVVAARSPEARTGAIGEHRRLARPGHHLAPYRLSSDRELFDLLGDGFTLLVVAADVALAGPILAAAERRSVPLEVVEVTEAEARERFGAALILVRPDEYVAWVADEPPEDPDQLVGTVAGFDA